MIAFNIDKRLYFLTADILYVFRYRSAPLQPIQLYCILDRGSKLQKSSERVYHATSRPLQKPTGHSFSDKTQSRDATLQLPGNKLLQPKLHVTPGAPKGTHGAKQPAKGRERGGRKGEVITYIRPPSPVRSDLLDFGRAGRGGCTGVGHAPLAHRRCLVLSWL